MKLSKLFNKKTLKQPELPDAIELNLAIWKIEKIAEMHGYHAIVTFKKINK
jgi:hypothetical protein